MKKMKNKRCSDFKFKAGNFIPLPFSKSIYLIFNILQKYVCFK
jgi:hypothetical protein